MSWQFELLAKPYGGVSEGPIWDGENILFSHIPTSRILKCDPKTDEISEYISNTNHTNGLAFSTEGILYGCCSGGRAIIRFNDDGTNTVVANEVDGQKLNTPNDIAVDRLGRIWFTNPWNGGNIDPAEKEELDNRSVLRGDPQPDGTFKLTRVTFDTTMPNGVLVSPDGNTLYVAESNSDNNEIDRELRAYPILADGSLAPYKLLHAWGKDSYSVHRGIDGMCLDSEGNILTTAGWELGGPGPMIYVFSPAGRILETHPISCNRPTNICFGGPDYSTVYVTSTQGHFFKAKTDRTGWAIYP